VIFTALTEYGKHAAQGALRVYVKAHAKERQQKLMIMAFALLMMKLVEERLDREAKHAARWRKLCDKVGMDPDTDTRVERPWEYDW